MRVILLHTPKGGSGKSTLSRELAVALSMEGQQVGMMDLDPQGTTTGWYSRRQAPSPVLLEAGGVEAFAAAETAGLDVLVVDTPPGTPDFLPGLIARADAVLVPVRPIPGRPASRCANCGKSCDASRLGVRAGTGSYRSRLTLGAVRQLAALGRLGARHDWLSGGFPCCCDRGQGGSGISHHKGCGGGCAATCVRS